MTERLFKHPRTKNLPWSQSDSSDDVWHKHCDNFRGHNTVVTVKLDGEVAVLYPEHIHARSMDSRNGLGRSWVKQLHGTMRHDIPTGFRVVGENVYAAHSIWYWDLTTYFYVFAIFDEKQRCLPWDEIIDYSKELGLTTVPVLYEGSWNEEIIRRNDWQEIEFRTFETPEDHVFTDTPVPTISEGYVVRVTEAFHQNDYGRYVGKMVRDRHVRTTRHWTDLPVLPNRLKSWGQNHAIL